jgi:hypothetical protein
MAVKWTTVLIGALDGKSNGAVTWKTHERIPANLFPSGKAEIAVKTRQVFLRTPRVLAAPFSEIELIT